MMQPLRPALFVSIALAAGCARHSGSGSGLVVGTPPLFETRTEVATNSASHADFHVADFDGDDIPDMAVCSITGELRILLGNGTNFVVVQEMQIGGLPLWMSGGDFDRDGDQDLVVLRNQALSSDVWWNDGNGGFSQGPVLAVPANPLAVTVGDLNEDTHLDVVVTVPNYPEIKVFYGDGAGAFPTSQEIGMPGGPSPFTQAFNAAIGDATRDGIVDLVVADPYGRVVIFPTGISAPFGTYWCELQFPGAAPAAVAFGDLSGDNLADLCVTTFETNHFTVVTGLLAPIPGAGFGGGDLCPYESFQIDVPDRPSIATIADVTGDGLADLVACLLPRASIFIAPQVAGGGVGEPIYLDATDLPLRPFVGDLDGNGKNDVLALSGGGDLVNRWLSDGTGRLRGARNYESGLPGASWMVGGDFDGDGDREVVVGSGQGTGISVLGPGAQGGLALETTIDIGAEVLQIEAADIDQDGRTDLIVGVAGGVKLLRNGSTGSGCVFAVPAGTPAIVGTGTYPFGAAASDFDQDGDVDIAYCDWLGGALHVLPGTAQPFVFGTEILVDLGPNPALIDVVAADFSGDGLLDLAVTRANFSDIVVLRNDGELAFSQFLTVPVGDSPNYLITADFNVDGRADLVVSNADSGSVSVLFGLPSGFAGQSYPAGSAPTALLAEDMSNDGLPDILVASLAGGDFRVMVGDGKGSFPQLSSFPGTWGASNAVLQDMDADGRRDLLISSLITHRVSLVRNITD